jgi:hypothetical protein
VLVPDRLRTPVPWRLPNLLLLTTTTTVGLLLVLVAWAGASGSVQIDTQVRWVNVGTAGVIVLGCGNVLWFLSGRRAVGELRRLVTSRLRPAVHGHADSVAADAAPAGVLVATQKMSRYHLAACPLAAGKAAVPATEAAHRAAGRRPCGVCLPSDARQ